MVGTKAEGKSDAFDDAAGASLYSTAHVYAGAQAAQLNIEAGAEGFGTWGGIINFPEPVSAGDHLWMSVAVRIPADFELTTPGNGSLKFIRFASERTSGAGNGFIDIQIQDDVPSTTESTQFRMIREIQDRWFSFAPRGILKRDTWHRVDVYVKFHPERASQGGESRIMIWLDGRPIASENDISTLLSPGETFNALYLFTYWNGTAPRKQHLWVDEIRMSTGEPAWARELPGRPRVTDWRVPAGGHVPAKMPLTPERVVHPRPASETHPRSFHRNAHIGIGYEIPIVIQGGAYPYRFEKIAGPTDLIVGETVHEPGYGIVSWMPSESGSFPVTVRVTDQDGSQVTVDWTIVVGTDWVRFVSPSGSDTTGNGTIGLPWRSLAHAHASTSGGRAICLRAGTYAHGGGGLALNTTRANTIFAPPGEIATIDCATSTAGNIFSITADSASANLRFINPPTDVDNPRWFATWSIASRFLQYRCEFDLGGRTGLLHDDNTACLFLGAPDGSHRHVAQVFCTFSNFATRPDGRGWMASDFYSCRYSVVAYNTYATSSAVHPPVIFIKGAGNEDISVRRNRFASPWAGSLVELYLGRDGAGTQNEPRNIELCYNTIVSPAGAGWANAAVGIGRASQEGTGRTGIWSYRNTIVGNFVVHHRNWPLEFSSENDVIVSDAAYAGQGAHKVVLLDSNAPQDVWADPGTRPALTLHISGTECHGGSAAGILDAGHRLQGAYRSTYYGRRGAEIYDPASAGLVPGRLMNLSTRGLVQAGDDALIAGFVIQGTGMKRTLIRAVGPTLATFGVNGTLADPRLSLKRYDPAAQAYADVAANDSWETGGPSIATTAAAVGAFDLAAGSADAALLLDLVAGQYSAVVVGASSGTPAPGSQQVGVAIAELYDADPDGASASLVNISTRGHVSTGDSIMIPGFVIADGSARTLLIRAVGPTLAGHGVSGFLADPQLTVYRRDPVSSRDELVLANDDWHLVAGSATTVAVAQQVGAFPLISGSKDAAVVVTLYPGIYTMQASGVAGTSGTALVEVYVVP